MAEVPNIFVFDKDAVAREVATITRLMLSFGLPADAKELDPDAASATLLALIRGALKKLVDIHAAVDGLEGFVDGLEGAQTTLQGYVDGLEALTGTTNSSLTNLQGYLDGLEALIGTTNTAITTLQGLVDGLEGKDFATQTTLAAILAKIIAAPATETTSAAILAKIIAAPSTAAKQDEIKTAIETLQASDEAGAIEVGTGASPSPDVLTTQRPRLAAATLSALASGAASAQVLAANPARQGLILYNTDANAAHVKYGITASLTSFTVKIAADGYWEMPSPIYTGRIDAIWTADGSGSLYATEL